MMTLSYRTLKTVDFRGPDPDPNLARLIDDWREAAETAEKFGPRKKNPVDRHSAKAKAQVRRQAVDLVITKRYKRHELATHALTVVDQLDTETFVRANWTHLLQQLAFLAREEGRNTQ